MKVLVLFLVLMMSFSSFAKSISIRADEWYPMNGTPESNKPGYMIELMQTIFEPLGFQIDYQLMPWKKALASVNGGFTDCVVGAVKKEAPSLLYPADHRGKDVNGLYVRTDDGWKFDGQIQSLRNRKVGVILGYFYGNGLDRYLRQNVGQAVQFVDNKEPLDTNIKKLLNGKVDTIIESTSVMNARLNDQGLKEAVRYEASFGEPSELYVACHPKNKAIIEKIDQRIPKLRQSGHLKNILDRYDIPLW